MAPERSLIPTQPPNTTTQCHASVIGVVPPSIHRLLASSPAPLHGSIDHHSSGLSHLVTANEIHIWEHSVQTFNEELIAPPSSLKLVHPECNHDTPLHVVTLTPKEHTHHVYASSPHGVLCLWILDSKTSALRIVNGGNTTAATTTNNPDSDECNACLHLNNYLDENEIITSLTQHGEWIFCSTSHGEIYKVLMTSRPLSLRAKPLVKEMEDGGMLSGLYTALFTPKKKKRCAVDEAILAMVPLVVDDSSNPGGRTPPRQKVARLGPCCTIVGFAEGLNLLEWRVSLKDDGNEGIVNKKRLFGINSDGSLDLRVLKGGDDLEGYTDAEPMCQPVVRSNSILAVVKISSSGDVGDTRVYVIRIAIGGEESLTIVDSVWLDRYAGEAISNGLECYGLIDGDADDGCVAYVGFGPQRGAAGQDSVTISAISFGADGHARVKDLDLFHNVIPSVVSGCLSYDSTSGGCVFLASSGLLGGTSVRFPRVALPNGADRDQVMGETCDQENVIAIKSHLISAFRQFMVKTRDGGNTNHAAIARSVIPPSINTCSASVLSSAAVMASQDFLTNSGGRDGLLSPSFKTPSPRATLREKLQLHTDFVNFLMHAGAYRKISSSSRVKLRDHGEMIETTRTCFDTCQSMIQKLDDEATDDTRRDEISIVRREINRSLDGAADNLTDLTSRWVSLQLAAESNKDLFMIASVMICNGIGMALEYRQESSSLYDIPAYDITASSTAPWTSSADVLLVLQRQLEGIDQSGNSIIAASSNADETAAVFREVVEDVSSALLGGHRDIVIRDVDNVNACQMYENAKQLCISLLRRFANNNGDDLVALQSSLAHEYFEGIVQICHDHRRSWMHRGPFSDKQPDVTYDIRLMLRHSPDSMHNLKDCVDFTTKKNFRNYVLQWYADKGMKSKVFELGKECPDELNQIAQSNRSFSELSWINGVRSCSFQSARDNLLNNAATDLWEKETNLSLAKLSNNLATKSGSANDRGEEINNGLTLVNVQRMLQEGDSDSGKEVMSADELISLAARKIQSGADLDDVNNFVILGLEAARTMPANQRNDYLSGATAIWEAAIQAEMPKWKSLLQETSKSVAGIPDNVLHQSTTTIFVEACARLARAADEKFDGVSYLTNPAVRQGVKHSMGLDDNMEKLFVSSAQVACG